MNINETPFGIARQAVLVLRMMVQWDALAMWHHFWRRCRRWPAEEAKYVEEPGREPVDGPARSGLSRYEIYEIWYESAGR